VACSRLSGHIQPSKRVYFTLQRSRIKLVRLLSTVDNTHGYARVSHSRQWSNYNLTAYLSHILGLYHRLTKATFQIKHKIPFVNHECELTAPRSGRAARGPISVKPLSDARSVRYKTRGINKWNKAGLVWSSVYSLYFCVYILIHGAIVAATVSPCVGYTM